MRHVAASKPQQLPVSMNGGAFDAGLLGNLVWVCANRDVCDILWIPDGESFRHDSVPDSLLDIPLGILLGVRVHALASLRETVLWHLHNVQA